LTSGEVLSFKEATMAQRAWPSLAALTPEAKTALGSAAVEIDVFPFRVGRDRRSPPHPTPPPVGERRKPGTQPTNELYLAEPGERVHVSRQHFQIQHNGTGYVLVDRQSTCGTIVEGAVIGRAKAGGEVQLSDGDVIIVGTSQSPFVFKFRAR
jgi:pSer/pThr/pTyr-binding forkhead associated (FHA) protein